MVLTTSSLFLRTLAQAGITHAFVNWGSDHPALLEDLERQRTESKDGETTEPKIVTCPNEMVALSAAQGYAQVTGKPAAVIVHVDVGTQALAGAVHNADRSRTPVLVYAGASPFSMNGELRGSRNEWIMWMQDIPDQSAIVRQYMRYVGQINSGSTVSLTVQRALQFATSNPKGPVYLWGRREAMEEDVSPELFHLPKKSKWPSVEPSGLSSIASTTIAGAFLEAHSPLIITSFLGRDPTAVQSLVALSNLLAIPIMNSCPSAVNVPFSHPLNLGVTFLQPGTHTKHLRTADVVLVIECDVPWIPLHGDKPKDDARVFWIDSGDPLKRGMGIWHAEAEMICTADGRTALEQIIEVVKVLDGEKGPRSVIASDRIEKRRQLFELEYLDRVRTMTEAEDIFPPSNLTSAPSFTIPNLIGALRKAIETQTPSKGKESLVLLEPPSAYPLAWGHIRADFPGSVISSGGSSLGYILGASVGAHIGGQVAGIREGKGYDLIISIVGDGSYLFGVPGSAYWMARKYNAPFLTVILNNGGWKSPKLSMLGVHPEGHGSKAISGDQLSVGFGPECPDYAGIATAASGGWSWGWRIGSRTGGGSKKGLEQAISEAVRIVLYERRCAVLDCVVESF
ncbi:hypothetical protein AMATHDRAFT_137826 [Amanita thiersii Skay4041]|uniref:Thiamine pyrophosphate enzyme TPP-binding domain-containing protein n=1 Tax=Amanita thiersii Skay4041 TaxID=703135 RepID=A0A2A9NZ06_9AGAR|nr:hypothetical protein AMATHDRAFT_137826 [Amanita thiersii Skay4041]